MSITKANLRTAVANLIDDPNFAFWTSANLDILISLTFDAKWIEILDFAPFYRSTLETLTTTPKLTSAGAVDLAQLAGRFYKIQSVVRDDVTYTEAAYRNVVFSGGDAIVGPDQQYTFLGDLVYLFPLSPSDPIEFRYSSLPAAYSSLADGDVVTWPDGSESALFYECAARALTKGEREENARLDRYASEAWMQVLSKIKRRNSVLVPYDGKSSTEWGGL